MSDQPDGSLPFTGHQPRACGEHRTVGPHRAWCFDCSEWCYPQASCRGCDEDEDVRPEVPVRSSWLARHLSRADREALGIWGLAYATLFVLAWASAWVFRSGNARGPLAPFQQWDADWQQNIAAHGYFSVASKAHSVVFFPGYPIVLAAVHFMLRNWVVSELAVSAAAGCVAVVALTRLAGTSRGALVLVTMPAAIFLFAGYDECLFLALAIPAWLVARQGAWTFAGLLAALAGLVRPDGVWLTAALVVMALVQHRAAVTQRLGDAAWAATGWLGPALYEAYLWTQTGTPWAWPRAEQAGWDLHVVTPWKALKTTWWAAFEHPFGSGYSFEFQVELAAMVAVLIAAVCAGVMRRWPEMTLCGLAAVALGTQTWYQTVPRTLLVLFPVAAAVAWWPEWQRHPKAGQLAWRAWLAVCGPLAVVFGLLYLSGQWAG